MNQRAYIRYCRFSLLWVVLAVSVFASCSDRLGEDVLPDGGETYQGEKIQFAAGTTVSALATRASEGLTTTPGKTYYMPDGYRFVCRMYYKASAVSNEFDVTGGTDITTWLKVKGTVGNSLYWRNSFLTLDEGNRDLFDSDGNDAEATCLYWQNRKEHAFLAWTDLNRATTIGYSPDRFSGSLKFVPADVEYQKYIGQGEQWVDHGFEVYGSEHLEFGSWEELRTFIETGDNYETKIKDQIPEGISPSDFEGKQYYYAYGWSCKYSEVKAQETTVDALHRKYGWIQYQMYYDKLSYNGATSGDGIEVRNDKNGQPAYLYNTATNKYLAAIEVLENGDKKYYLTDDYGNVRYDEQTPRYTFYFQRLQEKKTQDLIQILPANAYDLTRRPVNGNYTINSIDDQPDICQALTKQAPLGATQAANRVNLYFKHQFSQVQVNIKSSADLSVVINRNHIKKVELLGVSDTAYVFTELNNAGDVEPTTYKSVDISRYDDAHLQKNPYGTSFEMFDMVDASAGEEGNYGYPVGALKAYNALTFGQLQAIRITWNEKEDGTGIVHESTYHVADEQLKNLKSGYKYIWNIELRRGTLAIVRTEIVDWIVPANDLEYNTDGTIKQD